MSEYIHTNKFDTNECPNTFVTEKMIRTNVRIYIHDQYIRIFEYIRHTLLRTAEPKCTDGIKVLTGPLDVLYHPSRLNKLRYPSFRVGVGDWGGDRGGRRVEKLLEEASHRGGGTVSGGKGAEPATIILQIALLTCLFYVSYLSWYTDKYKYKYKKCQLGV